MTGKKRAVLRSFRLARGLYPDSGFLLPAFYRCARFTHFIAGPSGVISGGLEIFDNFEEILNK